MRTIMAAMILLLAAETANAGWCGFVKPRRTKVVVCYVAPPAKPSNGVKMPTPVASKPTPQPVEKPAVKPEIVKPEAVEEALPPKKIQMPEPIF